MKPDPVRVLQIAEQLDPVLIERAFLRATVEAYENTQDAVVNCNNGEDADHRPGDTPSPS